MVKGCWSLKVRGQRAPRWWRRWVSGALALAMGGAGVPLGTPSPAVALNGYCQVSQPEAAEKERLRQAAFGGDAQARRQYEALVRDHTAAMQACRQRTWPQRQAVWLRLYPCDLQPGILAALFDRIVNLGYNEVNIEVFYGGMVLLPKADNPTAWPSVVQAEGYEQRDLLAEALDVGRERGLTLQAWMFSLNFGYSYGRRSDRQQVLALNGRGQTTATFAAAGSTSNWTEIFVDPYHPQAYADYQQMMQAVLRRRPDGVLFDYIRYPRGVGGYSVADSVDDLWIYGDASRQALLQRGQNRQGQDLIRRYISQGQLTVEDIEEVRARYPDEAEPLWQSRQPLGRPEDDPIPAAQLRPVLQDELWRLAVAHAVQGVVDFLTVSAETARRQGFKVGAVFFPGGNQTVGTGGYDSRLQFWDRFPTWLSWHPMAYAVCGNTGCVAEEVGRVTTAVPAGGTAEPQIQPALAGIWGQPTHNRPSLEAQMQAIRRSQPQLDAISHFAYSWQDPEFDRVRKFCQL